MSNVIAQIRTKTITIEDDIFDSEEEKEEYMKVSDEEKFDFLSNFYFDNMMYLDDKIIIDLFE